MSTTQRNVILAICIFLAAACYIVGIAESQPMLRVGGLAVFIALAAFVWFGIRTKKEEEEDQEPEQPPDPS
jgi:Ca2+/Na+ antiporter